MAVEVRAVRGAALNELLDEVAALRIAVFRDWPYLYDGTMDYERRYLAPYVTSENAVVVGAFDGQGLIGASTGAPLADHAEDFGDALRDAGHDITSTFYCPESVLLPAYRGQGVGHAFFDHREAHARDLGFSHCCFCSVIRPADHPARPGQQVTKVKVAAAFFRAPLAKCQKAAQALVSGPVRGQGNPIQRTVPQHQSAAGDQSGQTGRLGSLQTLRRASFLT